MEQNQLNELQSIIDQGERIVFFTGAGVSTDSGIPDFRSQDGLYATKYDYPPEDIISHHFFKENPEEFYRFYKDKMINLVAQPNTTHKFIAELEQAGKCLGVVTQNIDGLHTAAGSKNVYELHGSILRNYCQDCHKFYDVETISNCKGVPHCDCGGIIKPDVVLYEEPLDGDVLTNAIRAISRADVLIVLGTSLVVYPAASLLNYFRGKHLVLINKSVTPYDQQADLLIQAKFDEVFPNLHV